MKSVGRGGGTVGQCSGKLGGSTTRQRQEAEQAKARQGGERGIAVTTVKKILCGRRDQAKA